MKKILFDQFVERIAQVFGLKDPSAIFMRTKRQDVVDARQMLFFLCYDRGISLADILRLMADKGLPLKHPAVLNGIRKIKEKVESDPDYKFFIDKVHSKVGFELDKKI